MQPMSVSPARAGASRLAAAGMGDRGNPGTDGGKLPFGQVHYRPADNPAMSCQRCEYADQHGGCAKVAGQIQPGDTCDLFEPMQMTESGPVEQAEPTAPGGIQ